MGIISFDLSEYMKIKSIDVIEKVGEDNIVGYEIKKEFDENAFKPKYKVKLSLKNGSHINYSIGFSNELLHDISNMASSSGVGVSMDGYEDFEKYLNRIIGFNNLLDGVN